jgi:alpha-N-arabinofuranosidase
MKQNLSLLIVAFILIFGCTTKNSPVKRVEYGILQNPSAEITEGTTVKGWTFDEKESGAIHFYDNVAHQGIRSLFISADRFTTGRWSTKVLLKPWSRYRFTGWIKTENLVTN